MFKLQRPKGQGLLEFALILPALLMIVLSIIEGAFLFQSYLAVQHAAREAARYAIAYQPPITYSEAQGKIVQQGGDPGSPAYPNETESQWNIRRVGYIKQRALDQAIGIRLVYPVVESPETSVFAGNIDNPGFFGVRVWGFPAFDQLEELDHPGLPGLPVRVRVYYRWEALDPLIGAIVPNGVLLTGEAVMINEGIQVGMGAVAPPTFAPPPTVPGPPPTATEDVSSTATPTPTPTWTPTPTPAPPTPTPTGAYIILTDLGGNEQDPWQIDDLPNGFVELHQHPGAPGSGPYRVYWTDNCGQRTSLNMSLSPSGGFARASLPDPTGILPNNSYLCGTLEEGKIYEAQISSCDYQKVDCSNPANDTATNKVNVLVPIKQPDLIVSQFILPTTIASGVPMTIGVEIKNQGEDVVTKTFDIDIYVDPPDRVLSLLPGIAPAGSGSPKQWQIANLAPGATAILNYVIVLPTDGEHVLKAQVDTSDFVEETDDENNISGIDLIALCSDVGDDFNAGSLDAKWALASIGPRDGTGSASVTGDGQLRIEGTGSDIWNSWDGRFYLLNQGAFSGIFTMTVKLTDYPHLEDGARAGLMVRESTDAGAPYVAVGVVAVGGQPHLQAFVRDLPDATPVDMCGGTVPITPFGEGIWLRIARQDDVFTIYTSTDGDTWATSACLQIELTGFAGSAVPGIFMAPR